MRWTEIAAFYIAATTVSELEDTGLSRCRHQGLLTALWGYRITKGRERSRPFCVAPLTCDTCAGAAGGSVRAGGARVDGRGNSPDGVTAVKAATVLIGIAVALLAGCGNDGRDCNDISECVDVIRNPSPGPLCYVIDGTPSTGCPTPTPIPATATSTPSDTQTPTSLPASPTPANQCEYSIEPEFARVPGCTIFPQELGGTIQVQASANTCCWTVVADPGAVQLMVVSDDRGCGAGEVRWVLEENRFAMPIGFSLDFFDAEGIGFARFNIDQSRSCTPLGTPPPTATPTS